MATIITKTGKDIGWLYFPDGNGPRLQVPNACSPCVSMDVSRKGKGPHAGFGGFALTLGY